MSKIIQKCGFTLAEVLITLGVIGVVAALTIPVLVQNADEKATVTKLKKVYSTLSNAYNLAVKDNGTPDTWGISSVGAPESLSTLVPYLNINKDCTDGSLGCFPNGVLYTYMKGGNDTLYNNYGIPKVRLSDGTLLAGYGNSATCSQSFGPTQALSNTCAEYYVDVNGDKGPNQWGRDMFVFFLTKYGIIPVGTEPQNAWYRFPNDCADKTTGLGWGCTAWIIYNENMDYLHCSDLGWGVKTSCS